jgi:hypothetical protein
MKNRLGKILMLAGAGICSFFAASTFAQSALVTYNSIVYDVTYEEITPFASSAPNLSTLMAQPWWGNAAAADYFAETIGGALGYPNNIGFANGPFFAYDQSIEFPTVFIAASGNLSSGFGPGPAPQVDARATEDYAVASPVPDRPDTLTCLAIMSLSLIVLRRYLRPQSAAA